MTDRAMVAPCGMNCSICARYLALKNNTKDKSVNIPYCVGCRKKDKKCTFQKKCPLLSKNKINYCFECTDFPCENLYKLDTRYRTYYKMSMVDNLKFIKDNGLKKFFEKEQKKWQCNKCRQLISCHNGLCFRCDLVKLKNKKRLYRW